MEKKLARSTTDRMIAGVAGGLAQYFDIDATLVRALFVIVTLLGGSGVLLYIILWVIMPESGASFGGPTDFGGPSEPFDEPPLG
jgi:phage shock protein PspC (stress-responsive transcriptional regulator)